jgi:hypothetical protein
METLREMQDRLERLEQSVQALGAQKRAAERRVSLWRGTAGALALVGMLILSRGGLQAAAPLEDRVAALERLLTHFSRVGNDVFITGANLHLRNGMGRTESTNSTGNLIVGYNEVVDRSDRAGSHNIVVGKGHSFTRFGGLVAGFDNTLRGDFASVSGGAWNFADGFAASVSGGGANLAAGAVAAVSGGGGNFATGPTSAVSGGASNTASGPLSWGGGGQLNEARGRNAAVSGGFRNTAGGQDASVSGGQNNAAVGDQSSVSGGASRTVTGISDWRAGGLFQDF